jgi:V8-like Glu-specific endopeptidase
MYCTVGKLVAFDTDHAVYGASTLPGQSGSPVVSSAALLWRSAEGSEVQSVSKVDRKSIVHFKKQKTRLGRGRFRHI